MKYKYNIKTYNSPDAFRMACMEFEKEYPTAKKNEMLVDVDGSTIQVYATDEGEMVIFDDYDVGAVFANADFLIPETSKLNDLFVLIN